MENTLIKGRIFSSSELKSILNSVKEKNLDLEKYLSSENILSMEEISFLKNLEEDINFVNIEDKNIEEEIFLEIPSFLSEKNSFIAFEKNKNNLLVAFSSINSLNELRDFFEEKNLNIIPYFSHKEDIDKKINILNKNLSDNSLNKIKNNVKNIPKFSDYGFSSYEDFPELFFDEIISNKKIDIFLKNLFFHAEKKNASKIFLTSKGEHVELEYQIEKIREEIFSFPKEYIFSIFMKLLFYCDIPLFDEKDSYIKKGCFELSENKIIVFFSKTKTGFSLTISLGEKNDLFLESLGILDTNQKNLLEDFNFKKFGFLPVFGGEKSGKTKFIYDILENERKKEKKIFSIEKIIEKQIENSIQIEDTPSFVKIKNIIEAGGEIIYFEDLKKQIFTDFLYFSKRRKFIVDFGDEINNFLKKLFDIKLENFKKIVDENIKILIYSKKFKKIQNGKKRILEKNELMLVEKYLSKHEASNLLNIFAIEKKDLLSDIHFFSEKQNVLNYFKKEDFFYIRGVSDFQSIYQDLNPKESELNFSQKIKKEIKTSVLKNALISSFLGEISIDEVLKFLKNSI